MVTIVDSGGGNMAVVISGDGADNGCNGEKWWR